MQISRAIRTGFLAMLAAAALGLPQVAAATVIVGPYGASVEGPEATGSDVRAEVVVAHPKGRTNLRKTPTFISVLGVEAVQQHKSKPA